MSELLDQLLPPPLQVERVSQLALDVFQELLALDVLHVVDRPRHVHRGRGHLLTQTVQSTQDPGHRNVDIIRCRNLLECSNLHNNNLYFVDCHVQWCSHRLTVFVR